MLWKADMQWMSSCKCKNRHYKQLCAFCRTPNYSSDSESIERTKKRVEKGDATAIANLGFHYAHGEMGFPQDINKALELWQKAGGLGHALAYYNIGCIYENGTGVEVDEKKAIHYYELAAMGGDVLARNNLGCIEEEAGNLERAKKHWMIAVKDGYADSLMTIQSLHSIGDATKEEYAQALRSYQAYLCEVKSSQRDEAAAYSDDYKYY